MMPTKTFVSEHRAANLLAQIRWHDGGSRRIEASLKTDSHRISERSNSAAKSSENQGRKH